MIETHLIVIVFGYFIFAVGATFLELNRIKIYRTIRIINLCRLLYIIMLVVIPALIYCGYLIDGITSAIHYEDEYIWTFYIGALYTLLAYFSLGLGYIIKQRDIKLKEKKYNQMFLPLITIFVVISAVSLVLWAAGFGGIYALITDANSIRAGFIGGSGNVAFFKHFVPLSMLASFLLFYYLFINKDRKVIIKALYAFVFLVLSSIISFFFILANDGRMLAGIYILIFFLLILKNEYEVKKTSFLSIVLKMILLGVITLGIIFNADNIFIIVRGQTFVSDDTNRPGGFLNALTTEFSFIVTGLQTAIISGNSGLANLTIVNDVVNGIFAWMPTSLKPISLPDVWDTNTLLIRSGVYGQSPTSIVAQSIYDLGSVGVIIIPAVYGYLIRKLDKFFGSYKNDVFVLTVYMVLGFYIAKGIAYFSIYNIMMNTFFIVIGCIIYFIVSRIYIIKNKGVKSIEGASSNLYKNYYKKVEDDK